MIELLVIVAMLFVGFLLGYKNGYRRAMLDRSNRLDQLLERICS